MAKILILGANSTGGSYATYYFARSGYEVIATSRSKQSEPELLPYLFKKCPAVRYLQYDLNHSFSEQVATLKSISPDIIINFASQSMVAQSWLNPVDWMQTNCVGQTVLLEAMRELPSLKKYIHFSTPEVYGNTKGWISENHTFNPSTPYASSRSFGDINTRLWAETYNIPTIITRAANIYSEGQHLYRIIPRAILAAINPNPLTIDGDGKSTRSFIHMEDVCSLLQDMCLANTPLLSEYHISPKESVTIIDLVETIFKKCGVSLNDTRHITFGPERKGKDQYYLLDSSKAEKDFNWRPKISISEGIDRVIEWFKTQPTDKLPLHYIHKI